MAQIIYDRPDMAGSSLPYSLEAEQSVLGAALVDPSCIATLFESLRPGVFYRDEHVQLFEIMLRLFTTGHPVDFVTVLEGACREEIFPSEADAKVYLTQLTQIVPSTRNVEAYANIVREKSYLRALMSAAQEIIDNARLSGEDAQTIMDAAEQRIFDIRSEQHGSKLIPIGTILIDVYDRLQRLSGDSVERAKYLGIPTGFTDLDRVMTGLNKSDLVLLAARPGMGKTSFALNIASNVAIKSGKKVAIFSLEMSREQLVERIMSGEALVEGPKMRTGELSHTEWKSLADCAKKLAAAPIFVDDTAAITVPEMKARLRRIRDVDFVIIDYLQLMSTGGRNENRVQVISEITRSLKVMAKELNIPVLVLSQLSRQPESRSDRRPLLSDLRDSGSIEQDADLVLFLYREAYYDRDTEEQGAAECIVAKNRHGETGVTKLGWDGAHTRFTGWTSIRDEE